MAKIENPVAKALKKLKEEGVKSAKKKKEAKEGGN
jgi:hypothetical protein